MGKLNHPPFNDWLLSGEPLTPDQNRSLQEHLNDCQDCRQLQTALTEVDYIFHSVGQAAPAPGFTNRWQMRLAAQRAQKQRRNAWLFMLASTVSALILLLLFAWRFLGLVQSPEALLTPIVYLVTLAFIVGERLGDTTWLVFQLLPSFTLIGSLFFVGFACLMGVLWVVTYRQLLSARRVSLW